MERGGSPSDPARDLDARSGTSIQHRNNGVPGGNRNQHGDGVEGRYDRHLYLERKLSTGARQLVRDTTAHHPPDRDLVECATVG